MSLFNEFSPAERRKVDEATRRALSQYTNPRTPLRGRWGAVPPGPPLGLYQLTAVLAPGSSSTVAAKDEAGNAVTLTPPGLDSWGVIGEILWAIQQGSQLTLCSPGLPYYDATLTGALSRGGSATATIGMYGVGPATVTINDRYSTIAEGVTLPTGTGVAVCPCPQSGQWVVADVPTQSLRMYQLYDTVTPGVVGSKLAYRCNYASGAWTTDTSTKVGLSTNGQQWGLPGEFVWGQTQADGTVAMVTSGRPYYLGTLASGGGLSAGGNCNATVPIAGTNLTVQVNDLFLPSGGSIANGSTVGFVPDIKNGQWSVISWQQQPSGGGGDVTWQNADGSAITAGGVITPFNVNHSPCPGLVAGTPPNNTSETPGILGARLGFSSGVLLGFSGGLFINLTSSVANGAQGTCSAGYRTPALAQYQPDSGTSNNDPLPGEIWGPAPGTTKLYRGLPGFLVVGAPDTTNHLVPVVAAPGATCWCVAKEAWHYGASLSPRGDLGCWVTCYPTTGPGANDGQYDGSQRTPHIEIVLSLRRGAFAMRDPNVVATNKLAYRATSAQYARALGSSSPSFEPADDSYLDDMVGSIRPLAALPSGIPQGWALMDGTSNSSANGGSAIDASTNQPFLRRGTPGTTGGSLTHAHTLTNPNGAQTAQFGANFLVPTITAAGGALPPYVEIGGWIERLNNGQS